MAKKMSIIHPGLRAKMSFYNHDAEYISEHLNISASSVRRRLNGSVEWELSEILELMSLYNASFDDLFKNEPNKIA